MLLEAALGHSRSPAKAQSQQLFAAELWPLPWLPLCCLRSWHGPGPAAMLEPGSVWPNENNWA